MVSEHKEAEAKVDFFQRNFSGLHAEIDKVVVGCRSVVDGVLVTFFASGNALLESPPGLGKTLIAKAFQQALDLKYSRIQFTPDLMPADIVGTNIIMEDDYGEKVLQFESGPVFTNILLGDEITRATPKTQSALLEAMQEHAVTVSGKRYVLDEPFLVLATQNPIDTEGTYPLPEAQLDRFFFKLIITEPSKAELVEISRRTTGRERYRLKKILPREDVLAMMRIVRHVRVGAEVERLAIRLVVATHPRYPEATALVNRYVRYGASPRGVQALILAGKVKALIDGRFDVRDVDIRSAALPALRHRILLNFEGEAEGIETAAIVANILEEMK